MRQRTNPNRERKNNDEGEREFGVPCSACVYDGPAGESECLGSTEKRAKDGTAAEVGSMNRRRREEA